MGTESRPTRERRFLIRAGLFVGLGLTLAGLVILLIGKERRFFDPQVTYRGAFENVDGLRLDAPVRLGGLEVGRVSAITFAPDLGDKRIIVELEISRKFSERVRGDSVARVTNRGVLGDKAIDISLGSPGAPLVPAGGEIQTGSSGDLSALLKASGEIIDNSVAITRDLRSAVAAYTDPELRRDVSALVRSARKIVEEVETGDGALHALVYDPKTARALAEVLGAMSRSAVRLDAAIGEAQQILQDFRQGGGAVHALLYDPKTAQAVSELGAAASELSQLVKDARQSPNGAVHQLVYGDARGLFADLGAAAAELRRITGKIEKGEGSLGAIINDPTVYEDLKEVLGNVKRNKILRALVRYSISNGENLEQVGRPVEAPSR